METQVRFSASPDARCLTTHSDLPQSVCKKFRPTSDRVWPKVTILILATLLRVHKSEFWLWDVSVDSLTSSQYMLVWWLKTKYPVFQGFPGTFSVLWALKGSIPVSRKTLLGTVNIPRFFLIIPDWVVGIFIFTTSILPHWDRLSI